MQVLANNRSKHSSDVEDKPKEIEDTRHHNFVSSKLRDNRYQLIETNMMKRKIQAQ